jgi:steroid delta-isomerase-like uncharacterized protein
MTSTEIRAIVQRYVDCWQRGDADGLAEFYTEDCKLDSPMFHSVEGRAAVAASWRNLFKSFSDIAVRVDEVLVDLENGDRAALITTIDSTHRGEVFGMPGTGRRVEIRGVWVFGFADRLIQTETRLYDFTLLLVQLGVLKARSA